MNLTINTTTLATEVRILSRITAAKSSLPVLTHVLFKAEDQLYLSATDLQVGMTTSCAAKIAEPGTITLPAKHLMELLEQLPNGDITIVADKTHARLTSGAFKSRLQAMQASEFPKIPSVEGAAADLPSGELRTLIERTMYAISDKSAQYVLKGALLSLYDEVFAMVATDGKRLSISTANKPKWTPFSTVIPYKTLEALLAHCDGKNMEFSCTEKHLFFVSGKRVLISQMLEGQFPKYERVIPKDCDKRMTVDRLAFTSALKRVGAVSGENRAVYFAFTAGALHLSSGSVEIGDADEQMPIVYTGPDLKICLHGGYVLDFLDKAVQPSITIDAKNENTPFIFTDGPDFVNVIMGLRP